MTKISTVPKTMSCPENDVHDCITFLVKVQSMTGKKCLFRYQDFLRMQQAEKLQQLQRAGEKTLAAAAPTAAAANPAAAAAEETIFLAVSALSIPGGFQSALQSEEQPSGRLFLLSR